MNQPAGEEESTPSLRGPIAWMTRNAIAANLLMLLLLGGGVWSAFTIQKEVFPQFQLDVVDVIVSVTPGPLPKKLSREFYGQSKKPFGESKAFVKSPARLAKGGARCQSSWWLGNSG